MCVLFIYFTYLCGHFLSCIVVFYLCICVYVCVYVCLYLRILLFISVLCIYLSFYVFLCITCIVWVYCVFCGRNVLLCFFIIILTFPSSLVFPLLACTLSWWVGFLTKTGCLCCVLCLCCFHHPPQLHTTQDWWMDNKMLFHWWALRALPATQVFSLEWCPSPSKFCLLRETTYLWTCRIKCVCFGNFGTVYHFEKPKLLRFTQIFIKSLFNPQFIKYIKKLFI